MTAWKKLMFPKDLGYRFDRGQDVVKDYTAIREYQNIQGIWVNTEFIQPEKDNVFHDMTIADRANVPYTTSNHETILHKRAINEAVKHFDRKDTILLDLGCGDGRFTEHMLSLGFCRIVAVELDYSNILKLRNRIDPSYMKRLLLISEDILNLRLPQETFDCIIAIQVLNFFFEHALEVFELVYRLLNFFL